MSRDLVSYLLLTLTLAFLSDEAVAQKHKCKKDNTGTCTYDLASGTVTGEIQRGPGRVRAIDLNTIRYDYEFSSVATFQASQDLWSGLSALAAANATPVPAPAPSAPPPVAQVLILAHDAFDPVRQAITSAESQITSSAQVDSKFRAEWTPIANLNTYTATLQTYQNTANAATAAVTQGGAALINYLNFTTNSTSNLVKATKEQLAESGTNDVDGVAYTSTSTFIVGTEASWPDATSIVTLQNNLALNANALNNLNTVLPTYAPTELSVLKAAESSITSSMNQLTTAYATFTTHNTATADQSTPVQNEIDKLNGMLATLQADEKYLAQAPGLVTAAITQSAIDVASAAAMSPSSSAYTSFVNGKNALAQWKAKMAATLEDWKGSKANPKTAKDPFSKESDFENCGFAFSSTKDTVVTLTRVDLTPGASNTAPQTMLTVKIECTTPFSLSAGVVFSTIPDHEFTISPIQTMSGGTTTTNNTITENSSSNFHPLPLALASMRFWEPNEKVSLAFSFGVAANIRDQTSGGSTAEYLLGPTIELFRTFIVTTGVHLGSMASVGGGYSVNSVVPSTITSVPINTKYTAGFGLGISFTKP